MDNFEFKFLKNWAEREAFRIFDEQIHECMLTKTDSKGSKYYVPISGSSQLKIASILLESMSPAKGWKTR